CPGTEHRPGQRAVKQLRATCRGSSVGLNAGCQRIGNRVEILLRRSAGTTWRRTQRSSACHIHEVGNIGEGIGKPGRVGRRRSYYSRTARAQKLRERVNRAGGGHLVNGN